MVNIFSERTYNWLKWTAVIGLPAVSTFIVCLGKIWEWGDIANAIAQSITAFACLLGALLGISHIQYKNGVDTDGNQNE